MPVGRRVRTISLAVLAALALGTAGPSLAQSRAGKSGTVKQGREHYAKGRKCYKAADYGCAVHEFVRAYELLPVPELLFDIAQAARLKQDYETALLYYENYLNVLPDAPNREDARARIKELEKLRGTKAQPPEAKPAEQKPPEPALPPATPKLAAVAPRDEPQPAAAAAVPARDSPVADTHGTEDGRGMRMAGLAAMGGALALFGVGTYFALQASDASSQLEMMAQQSGTWDRRLYEDGESNQTKAVLLLGLGGAALTTGAVLYVLGWRKGQLSVEPTAGGIRVACRF